VALVNAWPAVSPAGGWGGGGVGGGSLSEKMATGAGTAAAEQAVDTRTNMTCPVTFCVINKCLSLSRPVVGRDRQADRQRSEEGRKGEGRRPG
jgi:hypothetical protein